MGCEVRLPSAFSTRTLLYKGEDGGAAIKGAGSRSGAGRGKTRTARVQCALTLPRRTERCVRRAGLVGVCAVVWRLKRRASTCLRRTRAPAPRRDVSITHGDSEADGLIARTAGARAIQHRVRLALPLALPPVNGGCLTTLKKYIGPRTDTVQQAGQPTPSPQVHLTLTTGRSVRSYPAVLSFHFQRRRASATRHDIRCSPLLHPLSPRLIPPRSQQVLAPLFILQARQHARSPRPFIHPFIHPSSVALSTLLLRSRTLRHPAKPFRPSRKPGNCTCRP